MPDLNRTRSVRRNVERKLWSESMGHCMNPDCHIDLFRDGISTGEMAHIRPHTTGGDASFDNLVILCRNCHQVIDAGRTASTEATLSNWKKNRNREIRRRFTRRYEYFEELRLDVVPILERNLKIFGSYGPSSDEPDDAERYALWLRFEGELIANNLKLTTMLEQNQELLHQENQEIVGEFIAHTREFIQTRENRPASRVNLFPSELNSIFGVERVTHSLAPNVSALQNLIIYLDRRNRFIDLKLVPDQVLIYFDGQERARLHLNDRPRVHQTYWNGKFYRPQTTELRLDGLVFVLQWLHDRNIRYEFRKVGNLTEVTLNKTYQVFFCYEYLVSRATLFNTPTSSGLIVVNLHNWNGGPFSEAAVRYASEIGVRTMNQQEFFVFAHENLL